MNHRIIILPGKTTFENSSSLSTFPSKFTVFSLETIFPTLCRIPYFSRTRNKGDEIKPICIFQDLCPYGWMDGWQFKNHETKDKYLPLFLYFVISFQPLGSSKLKKYCNTFIIHHSVERMWI